MTQHGTRTWRLIALIAGILIVVIGAGIIVAHLADPPSAVSRYLWHDEFAGSHLNSANWTPLHGGNFFTPPTLEYYTDDALAVQDGHLNITTAQRDMGGFHYTSGGVSSRGKFSMRYGTISWQIHIPGGGNGLWPALWLMPADGSTRYEIDAMEYYSYDPSTIHLTLHHRDAQGVPQFSTTDYPGLGYGGTDHLISVVWSPTSLQWYVDGQLAKTLTQNIPDIPMFIYMNTAVGGLSHDPDAATFATTQFRIDYVRVTSDTTGTSAASTARVFALAYQADAARDRRHSL